ncbi:hypothetical protein TrRE_jg4448 [Triparma retinervis]|uniref:Ankyrin n=1 Tax=Triparma retinervis TaxID=2557542 RepID=A0A9W7G9M3_9STRA|nr:hypothetical protein TrRE_jg4448 [Triparma retinervis]
MSSQSPRYNALQSAFSTHPSPPLPTTVLSVPLLFYICYNGHLDLLRKLRDLNYLGRDVWEGNEAGMKLEGATPLWAALSRGHLSCAQLILSDSGGSQDGHEGTVGFMLELLPGLPKGFLDLTLRGGETALFKAAQNGRLEICKMLVGGGAKVGVKAKSGLDEVAIAGSMGWGDVVMELLRAGKTALHLALESRDRPVSLALCGSPFLDVNVPGPGGVTPLHLCALWGDRTVCRALVSRGADVHARAGVRVHGRVRVATARGVANAMDNGCGGILMEASRRDVEMVRGRDKPEWAKKYEGDEPGPPKPPSKGG